MIGILVALRPRKKGTRGCIHQSNGMTSWGVRGEEIHSMLPLSLRVWSRITHLALRLHWRRASDLENGPWACKRLECLSIQRLAHLKFGWSMVGTMNSGWSLISRRKERHQPFQLSLNNSKLLPVKPTKVADVKKLVDKYVPMEYRIVCTETRKFHLRHMRVTIINDLELDYYISSYVFWWCIRVLCIVFGQLNWGVLVELRHL